MKLPRDDTKQKSTAYLGLDVGATSLVLVLIDSEENIIESNYCIVSEETGFSVNIGDHSCQRSCGTCVHPCNTFFIIKKMDKFISTCCKQFNVRIGGFGATGSQRYPF